GLFAEALAQLVGGEHAAGQQRVGAAGGRHAGGDPGLGEHFWGKLIAARAVEQAGVAEQGARVIAAIEVVVGQQLDGLAASVGVGVEFDDLGQQGGIAVLLGLLEHVGSDGIKRGLIEIHAFLGQAAEDAIHFLLGADPDVNVLALVVFAL